MFAQHVRGAEVPVVALGLNFDQAATAAWTRRGGLGLRLDMPTTGAYRQGESSFLLAPLQPTRGGPLLLPGHSTVPITVQQFTVRGSPPPSTEPPRSTGFFGLGLRASQRGSGGQR